MSLRVADILVNVEESNVSFIGSFEISNGTRFNDTEFIKDIKFHYYSRWFIETVLSLQFISVQICFRHFPRGVPIKLRTDLNVYINPAKPTKIITHGWIADGRKPSCMFIKDGFLYKYTTFKSFVLFYGRAINIIVGTTQTS